MAIVVIAALMIFGLAAVRISVSSNRTTVAGSDDREAMALAEAGLSEAMDVVRSGSSGQLGAMNWPVTMGEGLFWVDATDLGDNRIQLVATGMLGSGRSALEIVIERPSSESPAHQSTRRRSPPPPPRAARSMTAGARSGPACRDIGRGLPAATG